MKNRKDFKKMLSKIRKVGVRKWKRINMQWSLLRQKLLYTISEDTPLKKI